MAQPVGALLPQAPAAARAHAPAAGALVAQPSDGLSQALQPSQGSLEVVEKHSGALTSQPSGMIVVGSILVAQFWQWLVQLWLLLSMQLWELQGRGGI